MTLAILLVLLDSADNLNWLTGTLSGIIWFAHLMYHENKRILK